MPTKIQSKEKAKSKEYTPEDTPEAGPSRIRRDSPEVEDGLEEDGDNVEGDEDSVDEGDEGSDEEEGSDDGFVDGMDPEGFVGGKKLKPLSPEALAEFRAAQDRAGVIYISRIPPGMRPAKVRHLMSAFGEVGRVYLQQEGSLYLSFGHGS